MTGAPDTLTVLSNLLASGSAILLLRRGPTKRLRLLVLSVGIMSLAQLSSFLYAAGYWPRNGILAANSHQFIAGSMACVCMVLLYREIRDRNIADRRLRLMEHEVNQTEIKGEAVSVVASRVGVSRCKQIPAPAPVNIFTDPRHSSFTLSLPALERILWPKLPAVRVRVGDVVANQCETAAAAHVAAPVPRAS